MATVSTRLALFATLALFGSGCTLHVVSGPASHQRSNQDYNYAMTPNRVYVQHAAPRRSTGHHEPRRTTPRPNAERIADRDSKGTHAADDGGGAPRVRSTTADRRAFRERKQGADLARLAKDSRKPRSDGSGGNESEDESRDLRYPYWISASEGSRVELEGTPVRGGERRGTPKALR
jgi:hypothetical protein